MQKSISHSPQALAWGQCACEAENRLNGLHGNVEDVGAASETVKTVAEVGVKPDELMLPKPSELAAKLDPVLSYAASLAVITISPEKAGAMFPVEWRK